MKNVILLALGAMLLTGCAQPTLNTPRATAEEIQEEAIAQEVLADDYGPLRPWDKDHMSVYDKQVKMRTLSKRISLAGLDICEYFKHDPFACRYRFMLVQNNGKKNASADGHVIRVYTGMMDLASSDEEFAMILAHEYSHNVLGHARSGIQNGLMGSLLGFMVEGLALSQGVNTGGEFSKMGSNIGARAYSADFEREADYVGIYIIARAGYDVTRVPVLWRKMSIESPDEIDYETTHPANAERYVAMNKTIAEIRAKKRDGEPLLPNRRQVSPQSIAPKP